MTEIRTDRLLLRPARPDDLAAFHEVLSHPEATRYWSTPPHESIDVTRRWLAAMIASPPELAEDFVVEFGGRVVGKAGFYRLPEVGYILHPDVWGRGLGREAVAATIAHVWRVRPEIQVLTADVDPRNEVSLKLLKGLGFVETGYEANTFLTPGGWADSQYLELKRPA